MYSHPALINVRDELPLPPRVHPPPDPRLPSLRSDDPFDPSSPSSRASSSLSPESTLRAPSTAPTTPTKGATLVLLNEYYEHTLDPLLEDIFRQLHELECSSLFRLDPPSDLFEQITGCNVRSSMIVEDAVTTAVSEGGHNGQWTPSSIGTCTAATTANSSAGNHSNDACSQDTTIVNSVAKPPMQRNSHLLIIRSNPDPLNLWNLRAAMLAREVARAPEQIQLVFEWRDDAYDANPSKNQKGRVAAGQPKHERVVVFENGEPLLVKEGEGRKGKEGNTSSGRVMADRDDRSCLSQESGFEGQEMGIWEGMRMSWRWKCLKREWVLRGRDRYGRM